MWGLCSATTPQSTPNSKAILLGVPSVKKQKRPGTHGNVSVVREQGTSSSGHQKGSLAMERTSEEDRNPPVPTPKRSSSPPTAPARLGRSVGRAKASRFRKRNEKKRCAEKHKKMRLEEVLGGLFLFPDPKPASAVERTGSVLYSSAQLAYVAARGETVLQGDRFFPGKEETNAQEMKHKAAGEGSTRFHKLSKDKMATSVGEEERKKETTSICTSSPPHHLFLAAACGDEIRETAGVN